MPDKAAAAFHWITNLLESHAIQYKITGGLAARAYGVDRSLADIDIEVEEKWIASIAQWVSPYIVYGPDRYKDISWDIQLMTLMYEGQEIDIAAAEARIYNVKTATWELSISNPSEYCTLMIYNKNVPVETLAELITYKEKLGRLVDKEDIRQLLYYAKKV